MNQYDQGRENRPNQSQPPRHDPRGKYGRRRQANMQSHQPAMRRRPSSPPPAKRQPPRPKPKRKKRTLFGMITAWFASLRLPRRKKRRVKKRSTAKKVHPKRAKIPFASRAKTRIALGVFGVFCCVTVVAAAKIGVDSYRVANYAPLETTAEPVAGETVSAETIDQPSTSSGLSDLFQQQPSSNGATVSSSARANPDTTRAVPEIVLPEAFDADVMVTVDASRDNHEISSLIYGLSGADRAYVEDVGATFNSWGGNPSTRYNWRLGNAWNAGRDWFYRNVNYDDLEESVSDLFLRQAADMGIQTRVAVPTLGWVAKDNDLTTCSFIDENGNCGMGLESGCDNQKVVANPSDTSVQSSPQDIREWMQHLKASGLQLDYVAMDNEPELWGWTHYDVHPDCTTYTEMLEKYLTYSAVVREELPEVQITGPTTCCWNYYFNSPAGKIDKLRHGNQDFIPWFLNQVRKHDEAAGVRHLDVLDIHFYPIGLYDLEAESPETESRRLRATASLWDPYYSDESWVSQPMFVIPRMFNIIDEHYPGTKLGISEWNFGADHSMNGAMAVADTLGIFGKFKVHFANYWMFPEVGSPGYYAFKMYTNYDNEGSRFGDMYTFSDADDPWVVSYASKDTETGDLHVVVLNKNQTESRDTGIVLANFEHKGLASQYQYAEAVANEITQSYVSIEENVLQVDLPPSSISHFVIENK